MVFVRRRVWKPALVAHRGDPRHAPENTLVSFRQAMARGAKAVEMDVRRCSDGVWIILHDPTLGRTTDRSGFVRRMPWRAFAAADVSGEPIPQVSQALALCRSKRVRVFLDVKHNGCEGELAQIVKRSGWLPHTILLASQVSSLRRWRRLLPRQPLFWVTGFRIPVTRKAIAKARRLGISGFVSYKRWVNRRTVNRIHDAELEIYVWTVRTVTDLKRYAHLSVDGMMSEIWPAPHRLI